MKTVFRSPLAWILLVSVLLRVAAAFYMGNEVVELPGTADQISYHNLALRVLGGHGLTFDQPWWPLTPAGAQTAHWSYLYTFYLVTVYGIFGPNPLAARILQAVLVGLLQPWLTYKIAQHIFRHPKIALLSAALVAGYAYFIYYAGTLMTEPFYITLILAAFFLALRAVGDGNPAREGQTAGLRRSQLIYLGLAVGGIVLLRQLFLLFIPFLLAWMWWKEHVRRPAALRWRPVRTDLDLLIPLAVVIALVLPFSVFNTLRFGHFVLLNTNAGYAFFWGNHPIYGTQFVGILPSEMGSYGSLIPEELRGLDEAELDSALMRRAITFITDDPVRYMLLSLSRIPIYFQFWPSPESGRISNLSRVASFGLFWPFMVYGLVRAFLDGYAKRLDDPVWLLPLFAAVYTGIHLLSWTLIRYRLPVDAVMLVFAAYGIFDLYQRIPTFRPGMREKARQL
jgi:hypothetical protein